MTPRALIVAALALYRREPARANQAAAVALSWLILKVGLDVDSATVALVASNVLGLVAGELTRRLVVPTASVVPELIHPVLADEIREHSGAWQPANPDVHTRSDA